MTNQNFSTGDSLYRKPDGSLGNRKIYTWESKNELTDVKVDDDGTVSYWINCQQVSEPTRRHHKIEDYFFRGIK